MNADLFFFTLQQNTTRFDIITRKEIIKLKISKNENEKKSRKSEKWRPLFSRLILTNESVAKY